MPIEPKIFSNKPTLQLKVCEKCGQSLAISDFAFTHSIFYKDSHLPVCNGCISEFLEEAEWNWEAIDKVCQWADIPFIPKEFERISELNPDKRSVWPIYARVFAEQCYATLGWADYYKQYKKLREVGLIEKDLPLIKEEELDRLRKKWGSNYEESELDYLEDLYRGLTLTQNVNGALQVDQAQKICKLSLEIDSKIRAGDKEVEKFLTSYDRLVKTAEFTPKNTKNSADFDSFAEFAHWAEKRGKLNRFYDDITRDVIDETLKNIQNYNQKLYINEGGIGEEIGERIKGLQNAQELEETYSIQQDFDLEDYDDKGFFGEDEDFDVEGGEVDV